MINSHERLAELALVMARARRLRLDASRCLNGPWNGIDPAARTDSKLDQARLDISLARIEWRKASAALWRLAAKMEGGEA